MPHEIDAADDWFSLAYECMPLPVVVTDADANIVYVNAMFTQVSGYPRSEVLGQNPRLLQSGCTAPAVFREMWQALTSGKSWHGELINRRKNGQTYVESIYMSPLTDDAGRATHYLGVWLDVTRDVRERDLLRATARTDELTGVLNRRGLIEQLEAEFQRARRHRRSLTGMLVDLDDFKAINDLRGHPVGDAVLRETAMTILRCVRREDTVGRYGGDEFLVLLPETPPAAARLVANRVISAVRGLGSRLEWKGLSISVSVGFVSIDELGDLQPADLIRRVDAALYGAKSAGKDRFHAADGPAEA